MAVLGLQNCDLEGFGRYGKLLDRWGVRLDIVRPDRDDQIPHWGGFDALLVGGTPVSATHVERHRFLQCEIEYLAEALSADVPCFGVCCGAELLAQILGARVSRCEQMEIGCFDVRLTAEGLRDEVLKGFPGKFPVFQWHGDVFDLPECGRLLVEGDLCQHQMFRAGPVVGVLFHLEVAASEVGHWADEYADELRSIGGTKAAVVSACETNDSVMADLSALLIRNFLCGVAGVKLAV